MNETTPPQDELSLRDLYLVLKRNIRTILLLTVGVALATFVVSMVLPRNYRSEAILSMTVSTQQLSAQQLSGQLLSNLPSLPGLANSFSNLLSTRELAQSLGVANPVDRYRTRFDEKTGTWNLSADGRSPEEARREAEKLLTTARGYLETKLVQAVDSNLQAVLAQANVDVNTAQEGLKQLQEALKDTPRILTGGSAVSSVLESQGVDPQVARSASPAYAALSLQEANFRAQLGQAQARIEALSRLVQNQDEMRKLVGQALQIQLLVAPSEPLRPVSPRPMLFTAVAGVLGFFLSIFWVFLAEAIAPRKEERTLIVRPSAPVAED